MLCKPGSRRMHSPQEAVSARRCHSFGCETEVCRQKLGALAHRRKKHRVVHLSHTIACLPPSELVSPAQRPPTGLGVTLAASGAAGGAMVLVVGQALHPSRVAGFPRAHGAARAARSVRVRTRAMDDPAVDTQSESNGVNGHFQASSGTSTSARDLLAQKIRVRRVPDPLKSPPVPARRRDADGPAGTSAPAPVARVEGAGLAAREESLESSSALRARSSAALRAAQAEAASSRVEALELRRELAASQQQLLQATREAAAARAETEEMRAMLQTKKQELLVAKQEVAETRVEIRKSNSMLVDAMAALELASEERNKLREELASTQVELAQAEADLLSFREQLETVREMMATAVAMDGGVSMEEAEQLLQELADAASQGVPELMLDAETVSALDILEDVVEEVRADPKAMRASAAEEAVKSFNHLMSSVDEQPSGRMRQQEVTRLFEGLSSLAKGLASDAKIDDRLSNILTDVFQSKKA